MSAAFSDHGVGGCWSAPARPSSSQSLTASSGGRAFAFSLRPPRSRTRRLVRMPRRTMNAIWTLRQGRRRPLSQAELAHLAGIGQGRLCEYEAGERIPALERALDLAVALGRPVEAVFFELYEAACERVGRRLRSTSERGSTEGSETQRAS